MKEFNFYGKNVGDMITIEVPDGMRVNRENLDLFIVCNDYVPKLIKEANDRYKKQMIDIKKVVRFVNKKTE